MLPSFFIAHGTPGLALEDHAYTQFLRKLAGRLPRPAAVVVCSAHWESGVQLISAAARYDTLHDFQGFPQELYQLHYPAKGDLPLSLELEHLLAREGVECALDEKRGLDHAAWGPLRVMYPDASIPVVALSVNPRLAPEEHYRIGKAISPLTERNVLIIGSGGTVNNENKLDLAGAAPQPWALRFDDWAAEQLETWNLEALFDYESRAPFARDAAPTAEHWAPLLLAMGAAHPSARASQLHHSFQRGTLSLSCWMFGGSGG